MLERTRSVRVGLRSTIAILLACALLSSCGYTSTQGRQQIAYARYVKKFSHKRVTKQKKPKKWKMPFTPPSQPTVTSGVSDAPQSVRSSEGN